ncbi:GntR family transcriptional regulator [Herbiconiux sp. KACC 21604]|uniref:GntR family transcriptional regulator n=1 Tax=unclassified Herbiconiux TaxID=2618217 RepID=UPI001491087D|nr:GntR family transcriptional regulator [Herbiconiux sp. SALV-R1]QJU53794.1 GntR family transcriptional regulator [Herbiconiux sp. SALV-R1]WPO84802.1 GntR family transcriptional regulator [Herbiconiux sp. KACC 21604]
MTDEDQRVLAGVLRFVRDAAASGSTLPGEVELAERVGCTRRQVRDVLASLEQQGVVLRRQGAATEVDPVATRMSVRFEDQLEYSVLLRQLGYVSSVDVLEISDVPMPQESAGLLMVEPGRPSARIVKRWRADGAVAMLAFSIMPLPFPRDEVDLGDSIYTAATRVWGEAVAWEVATPSAEVLGEQDAALFEQPVGTPVLTLDIVGIGLSGRRLFHARELHDPKTVSYSMMRTVRPPQVFSTARYQF